MSLVCSPRIRPPFWQCDYHVLRELPRFVEYSAHYDGPYLVVTPERAQAEALVVWAAIFREEEPVLLVDFPRHRLEQQLWLSDPRLEVEVFVRHPVPPAVQSAPGLALAVVIPSVGRWPLLRNTLAALGKQKGAVLPFQVVVVSDGAGAPPAEVTALLRSLGGQLHILGKRRGAAAARNTGIAAVGADVILCLDEDMLPDEQAVYFHLHHHRKPIRQCVLGRRLFISAHDDSLWPSFRPGELLCASNRTGRRKDSRESRYEVTLRLTRETFPWLYASSCHISFRREDWEACGGFDERFVKWGYEDNEFGLRLAELRSVHFTPELRAVAYHQEHPRSALDEKASAAENLKLIVASARAIARTSACT